MHDSELMELAAQAAGDCALVVVVETKGSVPRGPGAKMLVFSDGRALGTVGGGPTESRGVEKAREFLAGKRSGSVRVELTGSQASGDKPICGGTVRLEVFYLSDASAYAAASECLGRGDRVVLVSHLDEGTGACRAVADGRGNLVYGEKTRIDPEAVRAALDSGKPVVSRTDGCLYDPVEPPDRMVILGGGHIGKALARFAADLEFRLCVIDPRPEYADPARFPQGAEVILGSFAEVVPRVPFGPTTYAVVVSHSHATDLEGVRAVLGREYRYAGFIGSRRKTRMILDQAVADGFPPEKVNALRAPIGADIGAETPGEIAVSILAEIVAVRRRSPAAAAMDADRERRRA